MEMTWIKDRLPSTDGEYIVSLTIGSVSVTRRVSIARFKGYRFLVGDWTRVDGWMELPKPI